MHRLVLVMEMPSKRVQFMASFKIKNQVSAARKYNVARAIAAN